MSIQPVFLSRAPFEPHPHAQIKEGVLPTSIDEGLYASWVKKFERDESIVGERVTYDSDGYKVTGFYFRPKEVPIEGRPLVLFNRGGRNSYGMLNVLTINNLLAPLIAKDYLILASQYRGVDGSEGEDEFGGAEVSDITHLIDLAPQIEEWDGKNIFLFGWSRGGMMTLLSLKQGAQVNAVALGAPLIDLTLSTEAGQKREAWLQRVLPNYAEEGYAALEARSAPYWLDKLSNTPILLMHGDADKDVSVLHSRQLAQKLREREQPHKLVEYEGGNHYLNRQRGEVMQEVDAWFQRYLK
ncbi:MAG: prolyl oligopeptidase family serine peptidase [Rickettsiales bacterium]|nr:prolyl oligopeptidase family serine peptidase [Rickettsiales bacterium]